MDCQQAKYLLDEMVKKITFVKNNVFFCFLDWNLMSCLVNVSFIDKETRISGSPSTDSNCKQRSHLSLAKYFFTS